jgi:predicted nicotinamide N-methyase
VDIAVVLEVTRLAPVPMLPELVLHQAHGDLYTLWERLGALPYWAYPWPGGQALSRYLLDHPEVVRGRRVLDVGCGSGLVAVTACVAGAASVTALDVDPLAVCATALNADANDVQVHPVRADLLAATELPLGEADLVLAGDVSYEPALATAMLTRLRLAAAAGAVVLVGEPYRAALRTVDWSDHPLCGYDVPVHPDLERGPVVRTDVIRMCRSRPGRR